VSAPVVVLELGGTLCLDVTRHAGTHASATSTARPLQLPVAL
jgi:hypothetical protein